MAKIVGARLEQLMVERGLSQSELARRVGVRQPSIGRLISGATRSTSVLMDLVRELETTPEYLTGDEENLPASVGQARNPGTDDNPDQVEIAEIDLSYGLGGTYVDGPVSTEKRLFSRLWLRNFTQAPADLLFWSKGDGDSMEPTIRSGEAILIDRSQTMPRMADSIWALAMGEIGMIKRIHFPGQGRIELHSDNGQVLPIAVNMDELHIVGRVVAIVRKL